MRGNPWNHGCGGFGTGARCRHARWIGAASLIEQANGCTPLPQHPLPDRLALATCLAGSLLLLISFTTNYSHVDLQRFGTLAIDEQGLF